MAKAKVGKKITGVTIDLLECPVCFETMTAPIFQCQSGHSICYSCSKKLYPQICPMCRQAMTDMRNFQLEEVIAKASVPCSNKPFGCVYTMRSADIDKHLKECIFRVMVCPLGAIFGKCSWTGRLQEIMGHFKEHHPTHCNINTDTEVELNDVSIHEDKCFLYLVAQDKFLFTVTMKIDSLQKTVYWVVQLVGSKKVAQEHIYEIHIISKQDTRRKVIFIDQCFNNCIEADSVYRQGKCGIMPLNLFSHFILNKKFSFKFYIKRIPSCPKNKYNKSNKQNQDKRPNQPFKGLSAK